MSVLQAFESGMYEDNKVYIIPELVALFNTNWQKLVRTAHDCRISYPFYHLKGEPFWRLVPRTGFDNYTELGSMMKSFANLHAAISYAEIPEDLYLLMSDKHTNAILQLFLLDKYFPNAKHHLNDSIQTQQKLFDAIEEKILHEDAVDYRAEIKELLAQNNEEEIYIRGSIFKREIPKIYKNTCCISGLRIDATINVSMVDACHIVPFSESYNDTITNGIALCPNLHRAFDRFLLTLDDNYQVIVSDRFVEQAAGFSIRSFNGQQIRLPDNLRYAPKQENLKWHRQKFLKVNGYNN